MIPGFKAKKIKPTRTVGQRLKEARQEKELSFDLAEQLTKVKLKYLRALEADRHDVMPTEVYSLGFLRCYGEVLGLNTRKLIEQYQLERRAFKTAKGQPTLSLAPARRLAGPKLLITPKILFTATSIALVVGLILYIASGIHRFLAPPDLVITEPKPDSRVTKNSLLVAGETDPTASLTINGELVTIEPNGRFKRDIAVIPGLNTLEFVVINRVGKETKQMRKILADYEIPAVVSPEPVSSPVPEVIPQAEPPKTETVTHL